MKMLKSIFKRMKTMKNVFKISNELEKVSSEIYYSDGKNINKNKIVKNLSTAEKVSECNKCTSIIKKFKEDISKLEEICKKDEDMCEIAKDDLINRIDEFKENKLLQYHLKKIEKMEER